MRTRQFVLASLVLWLAGGLASADEVRGVIVKVDAEKKEVLVEVRSPRARGLAMTFTVDGETRIQIGHRPAGLVDLQAGERMRLRYESRDGRRIALSISAHGGKRMPEPPARPEPLARSDANTVTGILRRIALTDREIVVVGPGSKGESDAETTISVPEKTAITRDGKAIKLEDLKEDEQVAVPVEKLGGKLVAKSIQVGGSAAAPPRPTARNDRIERLRMALRLADWILQQIDSQQKEPKP
jgi:hypothetical protein